MKIKPGYKTSEFWFTLVTFIFSGLFLLGIIGDYSQKEELISNVSHAVESVILIGGQLVILKKYLDARKTEKIENEKRKQLELETQKKELEDYVGVGKLNSIININTANIGELIQLPHIGPALAQKIIDRRTNQPYSNIKEICEIEGIGKNTYEDIKSYITIKGESDESKRTTKAKTRKPSTRKSKSPKRS
jgi:competence ComEA-like helix-hairpin-helix protein